MHSLGQEPFLSLTTFRASGDDAAVHGGTEEIVEDPTFVDRVCGIIRAKYGAEYRILHGDSRQSWTGPGTPNESGSGSPWTTEDHAGSRVSAGEPAAAAWW